MREIPFKKIVENIRQLCIKAACNLPEDVTEALKKARENESSPTGAEILETCLKNADTAAAEEMPICQDTGTAVYFVKIGNEVHVTGGTLADAINEGTRRGYEEGFLRKSIVADPLIHRENSGDNTPAIIHIECAEGDNIRITLAPKGGGSENMSRLAMLKPSDGAKGIINFVADAVISAGGNPCPPVIVGVGIGGTSEQTMVLAKKALLHPTDRQHPDKAYADLEKEILDRINASGVGPQGLGGNTTALAVHIETAPCHIASMPVAVAMNCHAARHASVTI